MLAFVPNEPASGWSPCHSSDACDATRWPNLDIRRLTGYTTVSPSTWCGTCRSMVVESSQLVICFCFFSLSWQLKYIVVHFVVWFSISVILLSFFFFFFYRGCPGQLARTSTNPTGPEVNDHVSLQWPSYEHPQGSNLRPKREQTP